MRAPLFTAALLATALSSCCWDCGGNDGYEYLNLAFSVDSLSGRGFRRAELRTAYVIRYSDARSTQVIDTLRQPADLTLYWPQAQLGLLLVAAPNAVQAPAQSFRVVVPAALRSYALEELEIAVTENECNCLNARLRGLNVNGQRRESNQQRLVILDR